MPTHPASTQRPPDPMPEIGLREHERRYLRRSLLILCIVFGLLNVIGCRVFISPQLGLGKDGLVRVGYSTYCDEYWPSIPPDPWDWPSPDRCATFRGASPFVSSNYASASDKGMHYTMDVFGCGFPLNAYEIRTIRITKSDGTIVLADPPIGQPARIRVSLIGLGINDSYQQFSLDLTAAAGADSFLLRFQLSAGAVTGIANGVYVDDVALTPAPGALALVGLGGLAATRRRR